MKTNQGPLVPVNFLRCTPAPLFASTLVFFLLLTYGLRLQQLALFEQCLHFVNMALCLQLMNRTALFEFLLPLPDDFRTPFSSPLTFRALSSAALL